MPIPLKTDASALPRIAASSYLNSAPLIWSFVRGSRRMGIELIDAVPALCADLLAQSRVAAALIPVIEYQRISNLTVVPEVCVASREKVRSVVLATRASELKDVHSVALDESSRTSAALIKIIFREFIGIEPKWTSCVPDLQRMLSENDGALIIGDPGMTISHEGFRIWDMASLWREHTALGFVFAMWMIRDDAFAAVRRVDFRAACEEGLAETEGIIDFYEPLLGWQRHELHLYLTENITFFMDAELRAGLDLFYKLAKRHGLIPTVKPLKSFEP